MKTINTYIIEKFKINKNTFSKSTNLHLFKKGEPIYRVCIRRRYDNKCYIHLGVNQSSDLIYFTEIKNDRIYFISNDEETSFTYEKNTKINSNGFYESEGHDDKKMVYLNYNDAITFLEYIFANFNKAIDVKNYFDKDDNFKIGGVNTEPPYIIKCLKTLKKYQKEHESSK